jgi:hypothetical protein
VLSSQGRTSGTFSVAAATGGAAGDDPSDDEPLVLALHELLAVRRCWEPSLPEGGGIWVSTSSIPVVRCIAVLLYCCTAAPAGSEGDSSTAPTDLAVAHVLHATM